MYGKEASNICEVVGMKRYKCKAGEKWESEGAWTWGLMQGDGSTETKEDASPCPATYFLPSRGNEGGGKRKMERGLMRGK